MAPPERQSLRWIVLVLGSLVTLGSYYCYDNPAALHEEVRVGGGIGMCMLASSGGGDLIYLRLLVDTGGHCRVALRRTLAPAGSLLWLVVVASSQPLHPQSLLSLPLVGAPGVR